MCQCRAVSDIDTCTCQISGHAFDQKCLCYRIQLKIKLQINELYLNFEYELKHM